jgi:peptidoglycan/xylan/chitin deacetylase (PgdA/CDA1 family)
VKEHPSILKRIFEEGHQIGVHTWSHRALTTLTTEQIVSELEYTIEAIEEVTGARPTFVRPPFGDHGNTWLIKMIECVQYFKQWV